MFLHRQPANLSPHSQSEPPESPRRTAWWVTLGSVLTVIATFLTVLGVHGSFSIWW